MNSLKGTNNGTNDKISVTQLSNGLTLIVEEIPDVASAAYGLAIPGGLVLDKKGRVGSALILADLLSRGAGGLNSVELSNAFETIGVSHGEGGGGDKFSLRGSLLADNLPEALKLLSYMVLSPTLPKDEIPSIQSLLLQDIESLKDNPAQRASSTLWERYAPEPWNRRGLGYEEDIKATTQKDISEQWKKFFKPAGSALSIAGNVKKDDVIRLVESYFGKWTGNAEAIPKFGTVAPATVHHLQEESAQLQIVLAYPSAYFGHPLYYPAKVATTVLSGGMFGRLFIEVREKRGLCYSVNASHSASAQNGTVVAYAGTTAERANETLDVLVHELRNAKGTVTDQELHRAKVHIKSSLIIGEESTSSRCSSHSQDWWINKKLRSLDEIITAIDAVTLADLDDVFEEFPVDKASLLTLGNRVLTMPAANS